MSRLGIVLGLLLIARSTAPASAQWSPRWRVLLADTSAPVAAARDAAPAPEANELRGNQTEKKTIAQMIDEALEQEFPEEKEDKIGKNYNETAKSSDVRALVLGSPHSCSHVTACWASERPASASASCTSPPPNPTTLVLVSGASPRDTMTAFSAGKTRDSTEGQSKSR